LGIVCVFVPLFFTFVVHGEVIDRVVAVVEGHIITLSDLRQERQIRTQLFERPVSSDTALAKELVDSYIIERQIADYPNIEVTEAEVNKELESAKTSASDGLRDAVQRRIRMRKFLDVKFRQLIRPTEDEIRKYYDEVFLPEAQKKGLQSVPPLSDPSMALAIRENVIEESVNHELDVWLEAMRRRSSIEVFK
jgi:parvulin-like peptidyl-prolyl isomerase